MASLLAISAPACSLATEGDVFSGLAGSQGSTGSGSAGGSGGVGGQSQGSGTGGAGGAGTSGGGADSEDCFDGIDNDKDSLIDCADKDDCEALVECVLAAPAEWNGYARYKVAPYKDDPSTPPPCADGSQPLRYFRGPAGPPTCTECACNWVDASCGAPKIDCYNNNNNTCNGSPDKSVTATTEACISLMGFSAGGKNESCKISAPATVQAVGTCSASGGQVVKEPEWKHEVFVCPLSADLNGCGAGQVCAPKASSDYPSGICISKEGAHKCPDDWSITAIQAYKEGNDTRTCTDCGCMGSPACNTDGNYLVHADNACAAAQPVLVNAAGGCVSQVSEPIGQNGSLKPKLSSVKAPMCKGGQPKGSMAPNQSTGITLCCRD